MAALRSASLGNTVASASRLGSSAKNSTAAMLASPAAHQAGEHKVVRAAELASTAAAVFFQDKPHLAGAAGRLFLDEVQRNAMPVKQPLSEPVCRMRSARADARAGRQGGWIVWGEKGACCSLGKYRR